MVRVIEFIFFLILMFAANINSCSWSVSAGVYALCCSHVIGCLYQSLCLWVVLEGSEFIYCVHMRTKKCWVIDLRPLWTLKMDQVWKHLYPWVKYRVYTFQSHWRITNLIAYIFSPGECAGDKKGVSSTNSKACWELTRLHTVIDGECLTDERKYPAWDFLSW